MSEETNSQEPADLSLLEIELCLPLPASPNSSPQSLIVILKVPKLQLATLLDSSTKPTVPQKSSRPQNLGPQAPSEAQTRQDIFMRESISANQEVLAHARMKMRETLHLKFGPSRMKRAVASLSGPEPDAKRHRPEDATTKTTPSHPQAPSRTPVINTITSTPSKTPLQTTMPRRKSAKEFKEDHENELKELSLANHNILDSLRNKNLKDEAQLAEDHKQQEAEWASLHQENESQWAKEHRREEEQLAREQRVSEEALEKSICGFAVRERLDLAKDALRELAIATRKWDKNHAGYENALHLQQELAGLTAKVEADRAPDNSHLL